MEREEFCDISQLIFRDLADMLSAEERQRLEAWMGASVHNRELYERICSERTMREKVDTYRESDVQAAFEAFARRRERQERRRRIALWASRSAAVLILPLVVAVWYWMGEETRVPEPLAQVAESDDRIVENLPVLTLANGMRMTVGGSAQCINGGNGVQILLDEEGQLSYTASDSTRDVEVYNIMTTPVQCDFVFTLEDGTRVWLNAASELRYPVAFKGNSRTVYASGEMYFEVARDESRPFYVWLNDSVRVQVLGTSFNVNAYPDERFAEVTLVEGRVRTYAGERSYELNPNQQLRVDRDGGEASVRVVDVYDYIAWKDGQYVFNEKPLFQVAAVLERWYGVRVVFESVEARKSMFTGVIHKEESVRLLAERLNATSTLQCRVEGKTIYVK